MAFTKEQIRAMRENDLRKEVLIPLFRKMGYKDVFEFHGGSQEQGKDIVMWKPDEIRPRINFAVVVKAERITGQASGKLSANEVGFQIQQAFGSPFNDPTTLEQQEVHECIVVSSKEISKEAHESIKSFLKKTNLEMRTTFINGDKLWEHVEKYLPECADLERLQLIQKSFENVDEHYRLAVNTHGGKIGITVEAKNPQNPNVPPLEMKMKVKFPKDKEGAEKYKEFERHFKTGAPITIPQSYIAGIDCPAFLRPFFGDISKVGQIDFGVRNAGHIGKVRFEIQADDGASAAIDIELKIIQGGTEELTISNEHQDLPFKCRFVIDLKSKKSLSTFTFKQRGFNAHRLLQALLFQRVASKLGTIRIIDLNTGITVQEGRINDDVIEKPIPPVDERWLEFVRKLEFIQSKTKALITIPEEKISNEQVESICEVAEILTSGRLIYPIDAIEVACDRVGLERALKAYEEEKIGSLAMEYQDQEVDIFGTKILLGLSLNRILVATIPDEDIARVRSELRDQNRNNFKLSYKPVDNHHIQRYFPKWMPKQEADVIMKQFPSHASSVGIAPAA